MATFTLGRALSSRVTSAAKGVPLSVLAAALWVPLVMACGGSDDGGFFLRPTASPEGATAVPTPARTQTATGPGGTALPARSPTPGASSTVIRRGQVQPLGSEADCVRRNSKQEYCADLFLALANVDEFWQQEYAKIGDATVYRPPNSPNLFYPPDDDASDDLACQVDDRPDYCYGLHYDTLSRNIFIDEPFMMEHHAGGDASVYIFIAHEWGHHVQNIRGLRGLFTIQNELQADCYAGAWFGYAEKFSGSIRIEPGDMDEALASAFGIGDEYAGSTYPWSDSDAHGLPPYRVLSFRYGHAGADATRCDIWFQYLGEEVIDLGRFSLARLPEVQRETLRGGVSRLIRGTTTIDVHPLSQATGATAALQLSAVVRDNLGALTFQDGAVSLEQPAKGPLLLLELSRFSAAARRYEQIVGGDTYHGVVYLGLRGTGGGAVLLDVYRGGAAAGATDWAEIERDLSFTLLGLSLK